MRTPPKLPGLSAYPDLEKKYATQYDKALRTSSCPKCEVSKVIQRFSIYIAQRQTRDKQARG